MLFGTHDLEVEFTDGSETDSSDSASSGILSLREQSDSDAKNIDYVDGLGMALLRLEEVSIFPFGTKRFLDFFFMREIKVVMDDLFKLFARYETPQVKDVAIVQWD